MDERHGRQKVMHGPVLYFRACVCNNVATFAIIVSMCLEIPRLVESGTTRLPSASLSAIVEIQRRCRAGVETLLHSIPTTLKWMRHHRCSRILPLSLLLPRVLADTVNLADPTTTTTTTRPT